MESITLNGVPPTDRHEPHYGDEKTVYDRLTLDTYDQSNDGNGNVFDVAQVYGFARILWVSVEVATGASTYRARYDHANNSIRLFDGGSEVTQGTSVNVELKIKIVGTGG